MTKDITASNSNDEDKLPQLSPKQIQTLVAIMTSKTDAEAISKSPYSERHFYLLKPQLMKYKEWYLRKQLDDTVTVLRQSAPDAARNLHDKTKHRDARVSLEASKEILDRVGIGKKDNQTNIQVNVTPLLGGEAARNVPSNNSDEETPTA